ncbi:uncharacterized protein [Epargyreus clarus]|uniref:uncharacterized protein n=1 Tax=Epargyreus clarus TaxID=520877 RepID=UPI003C2D8757
MAAVRSCVCLLVILVHLQVGVSKPLFDWLLCDLLCDDDDISATTSASTETDLFSFDCSGCPMQASTPRPAQSIALTLPGLPNGVSLNVTETNGVMQFILNALNVGGGQAATMAPAAATAAPAAAPAANATAAPK